LIESKSSFSRDFFYRSKIFFFRTKKPLPFGTLGVHKKKEFTEANEAFFIFDCLYYNGESLLGK
jgi:ATP-dependent DNA ligase